MRKIYITSLIAISLVLTLHLISAQPYPYANGTLIGQDLTNFLCYDNTVTNGFFGYFLVWGFFFLILVGSLLAQFRFSGRIVVENSLLASSLVSIVWATILAQKECLSNPINFFFLGGITILAFMWVILKSD